jgi:hypothetical protein
MHVTRRRGRPLLRQQQRSQSKSKAFFITVIVAVCSSLIAFYYFALTAVLFSYPVPNDSSLPSLKMAGKIDEGEQNVSDYAGWRQLVVNLARLPPASLLQTLQTEDPFGVREMEQKILQAEENLDASGGNALNNPRLLEGLFSCPTDRITLPDQRNHTLAAQLRRQLADAQTIPTDNSSMAFIFFQHLRKAGGTNFCTLAQANLPTAHVPSYYCMPDYYWKRKDSKGSHRPQACAGCLQQWSNEEILSNMRGRSHWIAGNEWDRFDATRYFELPAVFVTSFRRPLHRALSQFRFECVEDRGCKYKNITAWWEHRRDLYNVYTATFSDTPRMGRLALSQSSKDMEQGAQALGNALDTLLRYHLVLNMEWLAYAGKLVQSVLGFRDTSVLTRRVRPLISQHARQDGQDHNSGARGIAKASWLPEDYLSPQQYLVMSENLALDELLTDAAQRIFLERVVCHMDDHERR